MTGWEIIGKSFATLVVFGVQFVIALCGIEDTVKNSGENSFGNALWIAIMVIWATAFYWMIWAGSLY